MELEPDVEDPEHPIALQTIKGQVTFQAVDFGYSPNEPVLKGLDLMIEPGEVVAIVGPTGAGKTTIINLLCRFYDPLAGSVLVDGIDLRDLAQSDYRQQIAVVLQDTFIFTGTIEANIRYGKPDATRAEVISAARAVGVHDYIVTLPQGYDTKVQERGSSLSAGQRQLIAFARALIRNPRILVLDEATSSIDTKTEHELQQALSRLLVGRTSFIIAHRLSTIKQADRIVVIHNGRIAEMGKHDELIAKDGIYAGLYECQFEAV
jgi:ATP-binding cassette subfamily B protein